MAMVRPLSKQYVWETPLTVQRAGANINQATINKYHNSHHKRNQVLKYNPIIHTDLWFP